ncbi:MAG: extracellular solute-binding protein [Candidatus Omnitrophica bacterium]|nr:extracellular solute-binding protein [Candidatus Omnitrophota bacterium]
MRGLMRRCSFLVAVFLAVLMAGCSSSKESGNKIILWHWMTDRNDTILKLAQQYTQETGIEASVSLFAPSDAYSQKVIAAAQANVLPDIYGILDKKTVVADFIKAGLVADLTASMEADGSAWKKSLFEKALADRSFDMANGYGIKPGIYGVPIDVSNEQMLYNKKLLAKAGIYSAPRSLTEFIKDAKALKLIGITPFVSGWGELWLLDCFASNYAFNIMGEAKIFETFRGRVKYTDPDWVKVFSVFADLRDNGVFIDGIVTKGNKYAEQDFALERAAFTFNGSWCVNVYHSMNPHLEYGVMPPPPVTNTYPLKIWGGAGSSFVVNAASPNKTKAIAFLKWLTSQKQQVVLAQETNNLPANRQASVSISSVLGEFAKGMDESTHPDIWPVNEDPSVREAFDRGLQAIIIGEKTPRQVAQEVQEVKDRQMAKGN